MDATHREFVDLAAALMAADDARFPAIGEHVNEHQRVLGELMAFGRGVQAGRLKFARAYVQQSLPEWFDLHLSTMDAALAAHLKRSAATAA
ncbi:hypothetical protein E6O51_18960 [Pseudothauera rhizosphaerae]|uniref:Hemerythrin-like metal-binding domain protein n=2 Tax=Pseudothauera rhizosphaerae TaxID=2565932 RepID=A0A4S4AF87_9RHOO|nr:hypothetical protein E6O51_18960 [Pseudothauera rhizosphaerae]